MKTSLEVLPNTPGGATLDVREVLDFLSRKWKLIGWIAAATLLATIWYVHRVTPIYTAAAEVLLEVPREDIFGEERVMSPRVLESEIVDSQMVVLKSTSLLRTVATQFDLANDPEFRSSSGGWVDSIKDAFQDFWGGKATAGTGTKDGDRPDAVGAAADRLREVIDISRVGASNVIEVRVHSADPAKAAKLADAVANAYVDDQVGSRLQRARRASDWLNERKSILQRQLTVSEEAVEKFKVDHKLLATREGTITEQQLSELNLALITARAETAEKYSRYQLVKKLMQAGGDVQTIPDVLDSTVVSDLRTRLGEVVRARADLTSKYGARHPEVVKVRIAQAEIERQISDEVARVIGKLRNQYEVAKSREESLQASLGSASGQSGIDNQETVQLRELERIAAANRNVYEALLARARLAEEEQQLVLAEARVISPASIPAAPTYPRKKLFTVIGLIFGLGIGVASAVVVELARSGFLARQEVEEVLSLPVLASVPKIAEWTGENGRSSPRILEDLRAKRLYRYNQAVESVAFGVDAINLVEKQPGAIQVTSAIPGEGKTVLAVSLAIAAARAGNRVLLIDADLRRSALSRLFGLQGQSGLVDVVGLGENPANAIRFDEKAGIFILAAGTSSENPIPLLGSVRMADLISHARTHFDSVVIDTPPVTAAIDAVVLSRLARRVIFAVRWNYTARETITHALRSFGDNAKLVNIVLTMVDERQLPRYGRYGSGDAKDLEGYYLPLDA